jgi:hypothetical protein
VGLEGISLRSNAMDLEDAIQFTRGLHQEMDEAELLISADLCSRIEGEEFEMHKNEATSGLIRYLALLSATRDVSVSLPGDPASNPDITPGGQVSGEILNIRVP